MPSRMLTELASHNLPPLHMLENPEEPAAELAELAAPAPFCVSTAEDSEAETEES